MIQGCCCHWGHWGPWYFFEVLAKWVSWLYIRQYRKLAARLWGRQCRHVSCLVTTLVQTEISHPIGDALPGNLVQTLMVLQTLVNPWFFFPSLINFWMGFLWNVAQMSMVPRGRIRLWWSPDSSSGTTSRSQFELRQYKTVSQPLLNELACVVMTLGIPWLFPSPSAVLAD